MPKKQITFSIPFPPSVNHYYKPCRWGSRVGIRLDAHARQYRLDVIAAIYSEFGRLKPIEKRLRVVFVAVMPDRRKRDLSNYLKAPEDALTHARVWVDDELIDDLRIVRGGVKPPGRLDVTISLAEQPAKQGKMF